MAEFRVTYIDHKKRIQERNVNCGYLVKFVDPEKTYPVDYIHLQGDEMVINPTHVKGSELTEHQIMELFVKQLL